jgi:hypothetical protein
MAVYLCTGWSKDRNASIANEETADSSPQPIWVPKGSLLVTRTTTPRFATDPKCTGSSLDMNSRDKILINQSP